MPDSATVFVFVKFASLVTVAVPELGPVEVGQKRTVTDAAAPFESEKDAPLTMSKGGFGLVLGVANVGAVPTAC